MEKWSGKATLNVLLACHNRKEKTLSCLKVLRRQKGLPKGLRVRVTLFDDGSTDGTADAVRLGKLVDKIVRGDGSYFWCGAMRALVKGVRGSETDFILLLNDDTVLETDALSRLLNTWQWAFSKSGETSIVVGSTHAPGSKEATYGGLMRKSQWHPFRYALVKPGSKPVPCLTFNANCVLVPQLVMDRLGGLDPHFTHAFGDIDLGLRASRFRIPIWVASGFLGACELNKPASNGKTFGDRLRKISSPKGFPPMEQLHFAKAHGGFFWPYFWLSSIIKWLLC